MPGVMVYKKRLIWVILPGIAFVLLFFQLPNLLKAMPSRYVARLPESVQALGERGDGVPILPTVAAPVEAAEAPATDTVAPSVAMSLRSPRRMSSSSWALASAKPTGGASLLTGGSPESRR